MNQVQRNWLFTWNNPVDEHSDRLFDRFEPYLKYGVAQVEVGEHGTRHWQGYLEFNRTMRLTRLKKYIPEAHWEPRRGTRDQSRDYCMKEDTRDHGPYEFGTFKQHRGKRADLDDLVRAARSGLSKTQLVDTFGGTYLRYSRGISDICAMTMSARKWPPLVVLMFGPTGCGKTRAIYDNVPLDNLWMTGLGKGCWFDGYDRQAVALMDDFAGAASHMALHDLLRLLDRYAIRVQYKGGSLCWQPSCLVVTTNLHPRQWYDWSGRMQQLPALARRFCLVKCWSSDGLKFKQLWRPDLDNPGGLSEWQRFWQWSPGAFVPTGTSTCLLHPDPYDFMF